VESPKAQKCVNVKPTLLKEKLQVEVSLTPPPPKGIYLYEVTLGPRSEAYQIPTWCSDWNISDRDMQLARDGSKTLNLGSFVRDLSHVAAQMHQPKIAKFHCYIQKK
jgi:hypothetical protein